MKHSMLHPQLDDLPAQPLQLGPLVPIQRPVFLPRPTLLRAPVAQRALVEAQILGTLRNRLAGLERQLHRARAAEPTGGMGLLSEEVDPTTGALLGNFPRAVSHIGLVNAAWAIAERERA